MHENKFYISFKDYIHNKVGVLNFTVFLSFLYTKATSPSATIIHNKSPNSYTVLSHTMMTKNQTLIFYTCCDNISTKLKITINWQIKLIISIHYYNMFQQTWAFSCKHKIYKILGRLIATMKFYKTKRDINFYMNCTNL